MQKSLNTSNRWSRSKERLTFRLSTGGGWVSQTDGVMSSALLNLLVFLILFTAGRFLLNNNFTNIKSDRQTEPQMVKVLTCRPQCRHHTEAAVCTCGHFTKSHCGILLNETCCHADNITSHALMTRRTSQDRKPRVCWVFVICVSVSVPAGVSLRWWEEPAWL